MDLGGAKKEKDYFLLLLSRSSLASQGNGFGWGKEGKILFYCFFPIGNGFGWGKEGKEDEIAVDLE